MTGRHREFLPISLGVFALVTIFALINDQAIAAIAPMHFTVYHPHYFPFEQAWAQAICFSLVATGGPGLAWGIMLYWVGHYGPGPAMSTRATVIGAAIVIILTAATSWCLGWHVNTTGRPFYPLYFYPDEDKRLYISQTVQLTNYLVGLSGSVLWLLAIPLWRWMQARSLKKSS